MHRTMPFEMNICYNNEITQKKKYKRKGKKDALVCSTS